MAAKNTIGNSFKWSAIGGISVKLITPILNAILARILLPVDYAPLATITMLISFCEVLVESGFKKYLIQHQFESKEEESKSFAVASWTTIAVALFLWGLIAIFCKPISAFLGNPEIWLAIAVSGVILPMYAMIGIYNATVQKQLAFKKLFYVRIVTAAIPLFITIPLAAIGLKYWSLIIGNIASVTAQMFALKILSGYKTKPYYSFSLLRSMFSNTSWTFVDGVAVWLTSWVDSLLITRQMTGYYLGLYKNSLATITSLFTMVTMAVAPVLYVGLTKYQKDNEKFTGLFVRTQRTLATFLIPMGFGAFLYRDLVVAILFGEAWSEAATIVGINALALSIRIVFISFCNDVYRAKGAFRVPTILQLIELFLLVPTSMIAIRYGFWILVYVRAAMRIVMLVPELLLLRKYLNLTVWQQIKNQLPFLVSAVVMGIAGVFLRKASGSFAYQIVSVAICAAVYFAVLLGCFPKTRKEVLESRYVKSITSKFKKEDRAKGDRV